MSLIIELEGSDLCNTVTKAGFSIAVVAAIENKIYASLDLKNSRKKDSRVLEKIPGVEIRRKYDGAEPDMALLTWLKDSDNGEPYKRKCLV